MATKTATQTPNKPKKIRRGNSNFSQRAKSSVFIVLYFAVLIVLAIFADPMCRLIPSFRASQWYPFSFFISIFALTI
jgi:hypothetical protein